jgi:predicted DNA-binding ribbon-helix-helix protein
MRRITVDLEEDLYRQLKVYCAENDTEIAALIRELLAERFKQAGKKPRSNRP